LPFNYNVMVSRDGTQKANRYKGSKKIIQHDYETDMIKIIIKHP
jgi:hypothetical protein